MFIFFGFVTVLLPSIFCSKSPLIYDNSTDSVTVEEGDSPKLECYASHNLSIKWHRDPSYGNKQNLILPNGQKSCECGNILEIPSITKDQRGRYVCSVKNNRGSADRYIDVNVEFAPVITESHRIDRLDRKELELYCSAISYPPPAIGWFRNDTELRANFQYKIINKYEFEDETNSTLIISTESDYHGTYECYFGNPYGTTRMAFEVSAPVLKRERTAEKY